ncbi:uncharacterized protein [Rutidosis leptorrhynchoides]|uniref:uncharacterized protein n=1 Tax=Rutidosis leptorrhynchoides TaxID=125765 RepID=UPI003A9929DF
MGIAFKASFKKKIRNGDTFKFWDDAWIGDIVLKEQFNRLYALENHKEVSVSVRFNNNRLCDDWARPIRGRAVNDLVGLKILLESANLLSEQPDSWKWILDDDGFYKTKTMSRIIDEKCAAVITNPEATLRNKAVPLKVEVFVWRAKQKRIPVRIELEKRSIDLDSTICPLCAQGIESVEHFLTSCPKTLDIWNLVLKWWNLPQIQSLSHDQIFDDVLFGPNASSMGKVIWQGLKWVTCYVLWKARNDSVFNNQVWMAQKILTSIQTSSFVWFSKRIKKSSLVWHQWLINPGSFGSTPNNRV